MVKGFVWTYLECPDCEHMLKHVISSNHINSTILETISSTMRRIKMHRKLRQVLKKGLSYCLTNTHAKDSFTFLHELMSSFDYANRIKESGKMQNIRNVLENISPEWADHIARHYIHRLVTEFIFQDWFYIRALGVDVYTCGLIMHEEFDFGVVYAGMKHTENIEQCLMGKDWKHIETPEGLKEIEVSAQEKMDMVRCIQYKNMKTVLLLGEVHTKTTIDFATSFLQKLESKCSLKKSRYTFFVERHIKHTTEKSIPELLACNKSDEIAIQHVRCAPIIDYAETICDSLDVKAIDVRHIDFSFLRYELFDIRHNDFEFQSAYKKFTERARKQFVRFLEQFKSDSEQKLSSYQS